MGTDIINFVTWVNNYCALNARADTIPDDPNGRISGSRFRRTLAWHIVRRPRGLVAAAIQYGHVATYVTQGYSGTYASGFPDELSMERWLERIEDVEALETYLNGGGHVSGPAAPELDHRTRKASAKFLGRSIPTRRQASSLLTDPALQVFKGSGMHCVYNKATALCARDNDGPALGECRSECSNIARTDEDIADLTKMVADLTADVLAPPIRYQRTQQVAEAVNKSIQQHERSRTDD